MKKLFFLLITNIWLGAALAQSLAVVDQDLASAYKNIEAASDRHDDLAVQKANQAFISKLKAATAGNATTLKYPFNMLKAAHVNVVSSPDGLFRIYSWDTWKGGTMHIFQNLFQFRLANKQVSIFEKQDIDADVSYEKVYTFQNAGRNYYLAAFLFVESSRYSGGGIEVYAIENGKLNSKVNLIKTASGLTNSLLYEYEFSPEKRDIVDPIFNADTKTIKIPLIDAKLNPTGKYITYKFNGQYFVKVK